MSAAIPTFDRLARPSRVIPAGWSAWRRALRRAFCPPTLRQRLLRLALLCMLPAMLAAGAATVATWTAWVARPEPSLPAALGPWSLALAVLCMGLCVLGLLAARRVSGQIERTIGALVTTAGALERGEPVMLPRMGLAELDAIGSALGRVAGLLQDRAAERDEAQQAGEALRRHNRQLAHAAEHDPLTGLFNRAAFAAALNRRMEDARDLGASLTLLFIDIDDFKPVNDRHGHSIGDDLLYAFARRLREAVRSSDVVARLGGDEFAVLLDGPAPADALSIGMGLVDRLSRPYAIREHVLRVSACIGLAGFPGHASTAEALMEAADAAMYEAKRGGKRHCSVSDFTPL